MSQNFFVSDDLLSLDYIRSILIRLEDTIIFALIERAQFAHNPVIYRPGAFKELKDIGFHGTWLEWFLKEIETFHGIPCSARLRLYVEYCLSQGAQVHEVSLFKASGATYLLYSIRNDKSG